MDDNFELEDKNIEEVKEVVKSILNTLPRSVEYSLVPMYYKFNEDLETKLDPLVNEDERFYNICLNTGNLSWVKGFQTAMKYCSTTFGLKLKEAPPIQVVRDFHGVSIPISKIPHNEHVRANVDMFMKEFRESDHEPTVLPKIILDRQAFILGIFFASFVWFLLALFGLLK